jgi:hypothetical protein
MIFDDKKMTKMMRCFDLFEDFKFIGEFVTASTKTSDFIPRWIEDDRVLLVAQIIGGKYKIKPDYEDSFVSTGTHFFPLKEYCKQETEK